MIFHLSPITAYWYSVKMDVEEPMQVDDQEASIPPRVEFTVENPTVDLETYVGGSEGFSRIRRLMFIAKHCPSMQVEALKMALSTVEQTLNTKLYSEIRHDLHQVTGDPAYAPDQEEAVSFILATNKKADIILERLDSDLKNYRSNSIKESIRRGFDALGDHYLDRGDYGQALKMFTRARDHCTSAKHVVSMCMNVMKVAIQMSNWQQSLNYFGRADTTLEMDESFKTQPNLSVASRLKCAAGLCELMVGRYKNAARQFLQTSFEHTKFPDLLSPYSVAVYCSLCALASYDRQELHSKVLVSSSSFKPFLELEPQMRDAILQFHHSRYASCLKVLEEMREGFMLDVYLANHIPVLYKQIRNKALIQYFSPYLSVDLHKMSAALNTSVSSLENELTELILDGQISARIDSHAKIMYARQVDQRSAIFQKALEVGEAYQLRTKALLMRSLMQKKGMTVSLSSAKKGDDVSSSDRRQWQRY